MSDADRQQRLARALRENLKRRKTQTREVAFDPKPDEPQRQDIHVPACAATAPQP